MGDRAGAGLVWAGVALMLVCVDSAAAQADKEASGGIEEIVVRARRRAELLEDTPVSVTALSADTLQATQAESLEDVAALVPNLTILSGRSNQDASIVIRGVGAFPFIYFDQGVGTYVDGVFLSRQQGALLDIVDLAQVEVLRGPQGTLFGKNTVGGALNITTKEPTDEVEGSIRVRTGSYNNVDTKATLNIPIDRGWFTDRLATRFTFASFYNEGYSKNLETGNRASDRNSLNFLGSARLRLTDDVTFTLSGTWTREQNRGLGGQCHVVQESGFPTQDINAIPPGFFDACRRSTDPFEFRSEIDGFANSVTYGTWGTLRWGFGEALFFDDLNLRYIGSWRGQDTATQDDGEMTAFPVFRISQRGGGGLADGGATEARQIQQELQVVADTWDDRISIVAGAFGYWEDARTDTGLRVLTGNQIVDTIGTTDNFVETDNWDWALFTQAVVDVTEWLSLTGGVRYTQEKKALFRLIENACFDDTSGLCASPPLGDEIIVPPTFSKEIFDAWTPSATVALTAPDSLLDRLWQTDHLMTYFTYARGFRGGGFNGGARTTSLESLTSFDPEFIDSYEIGVKAALFDRRLTLSGAIFQADRDDQQVPQIVSQSCPDPVCPTDVFTRNAAKTRSRGVELELAALPFKGFSANGSIGYVDAEFLDFPEAQDAVTGESINRAGERFPFLPAFQSNLGVQYTYGLPALDVDWLNGDLVSRLDWYYESEVTNWAPEIQALTQPGYNRLNLRIAYLFNEDASEVAFWSKNLTDEEYFKNTLSWARLTGTVVRYYEPPRTFGVELSHRF
jgi:iron complex outermembrane recepter protein